MGEIVELTSQGEKFAAYLASPRGNVRGGLVLIHEVWALEDHIKDVANRYAEEGYIVLAPNLLAETDLNIYAPRLKLDLFNPKTRN